MKRLYIRYAIAKDAGLTEEDIKEFNERKRPPAPNPRNDKYCTGCVHWPWVPTYRPYQNALYKCGKGYGGTTSRHRRRPQACIIEEMAQSAVSKLRKAGMIP